MSSISKEAKLAELRAKTDLELARYVTSELNLAVRFATDSTQQSRSRAKMAYAEAARLLPLIQNLDHSQRQRLDAQLRSLRQILDQKTALTHAAV